MSQLCSSLLHKYPGSTIACYSDRAKVPAERVWYIQQTIENGWSRNVLVMQIESGLYRRQGKSLTNFQATLPTPQSDLAQQLIKDPYNFDFLTLAAEAQERDLEKGLLSHLRQFLIELGVGFAFVGSQVPLEVGGEDFKTRSALLSPEASMLRCDRSEDGIIQAGVCG